MSYANGPKIVTDGLVCCLDAANRKSYPGSGSTWYDLSGGNRHATLASSTETPTFNANNKNGAFYFTGGDYMSPSSSIRTTILNARPYCVSVWVYKASTDTAGMCVYDCDRTRFNLNFNTYVSNKWSFDYYDGTEVVLTDNGSYSDRWVNFLVQHHSDGLMELYVNGQLGDSQTSVGNMAANGNAMVIGRALQSNYQQFKGSIANFSVYDRALSANEILQNYNALKGRYGLN